jgi:elongation factor G
MGARSEHPGLSPSADAELARLRNFGVVAHIDAGKTTLCERMLVCSGVESRLGAVEEGTTVLDWMQEERERGISITAAATHLPWRGSVLQLIDTPGHVDFTIEVERSLAVLDGAVIVFDALAGVQAQSEAVWRQLRRRGVAAVAFVNKLDRPGADFLGAVAGIEKRLGVRCVPVAYPCIEGGVLTGVADLVRQVVRGASRPGAGPVDLPLPKSLAEEVGVLRAELIEVLALEDEPTFECLAAGGTPMETELLAALARATRRGKLLPVACGSALHGLGIEGVLDLVVDCLPSPADVPPPSAQAPAGGGLSELLPRPTEPVALLAFKLQRIADRDLVFVRVLRGTLRAGQELVVARSGRREVSRGLYRTHADSLEPVPCALPGQIVAVEGLDSASTGDTLCDPADVRALGGLELPEPVLSLAVEPAGAGDQAPLREALGRLVREDPSLTLREDESSGQFVLSGMGELHLEIALEHLGRLSGFSVRRSAPRVAYREVPQRSARAAARIERVFGQGVLSGAIELELIPAREVPGVEVSFEPGEQAGQALAEPGLRDALTATLTALAAVGPAAGFPLAHGRILVRDARAPGPESRPPEPGAAETEPPGDGEAGLLQAAGSAWHELLSRLEVDIEEPLMALEVSTPAEYARGVIGDLESRGALISEVQSEGRATRVQASVALAPMFGYASALRSLSQGRAVHSLRPAGTRVVPRAQWGERGLSLH